MKQFLTACAGFGLMAAAASAANAALLINGGFESSTLTPTEQLQMANLGDAFLKAGDPNLTGWTIGGAGVTYVGPLWTPAAGTHSLELSSAGGAGSISTTLFSLDVGTTYTVSFDLAGDPRGGPATKLAIADVTGAPGGAYFFDTTGKTTTHMGWTVETYDFKATSTSMVLTLSSSNQQGFVSQYGPVIDNLRIGALPEPAAWALMLLGFGGAGAAMRARRRVAAG